MTDINAFQPNGSTVNEATTASSQALALTGVGTGAHVVITNIGSQVIFVAFGISTVTTAVTTGHPILANSAQIFTVPQGVTHVAHRAAATGSTLYATSGQGV